MAINEDNLDLDDIPTAVKPAKEKPAEGTDGSMGICDDASGAEAMVAA